MKLIQNVAAVTLLLTLHLLLLVQHCIFVAAAASHTDAASTSRSDTAVVSSTSSEENVHRNIIEDCLKKTAECMAQHEKRSCDRPFITLAYAQSLDGKIAIKNNNNNHHKISSSSNFAISSPESLVLTHALRSQHDAILVGGNTLVTDNPRLTSRLWNEQHSSNTQQPRPVVLDTSLRHLRRFLAAGDEHSTMNAKNLIVCCSQEAATQYNSEVHDNDDELSSIITLLPCRLEKCDYNKDDKLSLPQLDLRDVLERLQQQFGIRSVMVEGGAAVLSSFVRKRNLVDLFCVTISNQLIGDRYGLSPMLGTLAGDNDESDTFVAATTGGTLNSVKLGPDVVVFSSHLWER